jgi:hypothetical protein
VTLYGIICFFRNRDNQLYKLLLKVPEAIEHTGNTITDEVLAILHAFDIGPDRIGYFTFENAENNTTTIIVIGGDLGFDGESRRGRCIEHTINLAAKALLFGNNPDAFEKQLDSSSAINSATYQLWRSQGPVGKSHNLIVDVRNLHKLHYRFQRPKKRAESRSHCG